MRKLIMLMAGVALTLTACDHKVESGDSTLVAPSAVAVERTADDAVTVTWKDNSTGESGFDVLMREVSNPEWVPAAQVAADITEAVLTNKLEEGKSYFVGVRAYNNAGQSRIVSVRYDMAVLADQPTATIATLTSGKNNISATYSVTNIEGQTGVEWGLCWGKSENPTVGDGHLSGPALDKNGNVFQVIPDTELDFGVDYYVRAYVKTSMGTFYSKGKNVGKMTEDFPAIKLEWTKLTDTGLPAGIEVYKTTSKLNGDNFNAWYAIADCSGDIELRVLDPGTAKTIDEQSAAFNGDCYVLINGGYFYNSKHTGIAVVDGTLTGSVNDVRGSLKTADEEYNVMYCITRGAFGVDASGKPAGYWAGTDAAGKTAFYDTPLATVKGENKYGKPSATLPEAPVKWTPKQAVSAGPLLLKDSKVPFDFTTTSKGADFYLTNYEVMPYDIFGTNVTPDRTAIGATADGKIVLFICDGRIAASDGANLVELAQIMKGLGCVDALNLDGGGSTGMMVGNKHVNNQQPNNRPVVTTVGFFKKR